MPDVSQPRKLNLYEKIIKLEDFFQENKNNEFFTKEYPPLRRAFWRGLLTNKEYCDRMQEIISSFLQKEIEKSFGAAVQALKDTE